QMSDATGVINIGSAPLGEEGGQSSRIAIVGSRSADQDRAAGSRLKRRRPGAADENIPALSANEPIEAGASHQDVVGSAARDIQNSVAITREEQSRHADVGQHAINGLSGSLDNIIARLAVDAHVSRGQKD